MDKRLSFCGKSIGGYPEKRGLCGGRQGKNSRLFCLFAFTGPTYEKITGGQWLDEEKPYHVIHRIAGAQGVHGIFNSMLEYAFLQENNIRIDTHKDNVIMRHLLQKHGFSYCGVIYLLSGDERLAYQKIIK
ncbi:MAG: GNAT family N-acetyltransferase [Bacteroidales bacterium]|nr:GNAT family N-acetyltransferase [Bacteroidales bacterium]